MTEENVFKKFGAGRKNPDDDFFTFGDTACHMKQREGIVNTIDEDVKKRLVESFPCCIPTCKLVFPSLSQFEMHYNSSHRFICCQCKKSLPSPHILDLHLCEVHDSFFKTQAERKPMYRCFLESCNFISRTADQRRSHCIEVHKFPHDFRFDYKRNGTKGKTQGDARNLENNNTNKNITYSALKQFTFGRASAKGYVFVPKTFKRPSRAREKRRDTKQRLRNDFEEVEPSSLNMNELMETLPL